MMDVYFNGSINDIKDKSACQAVYFVTAGFIKSMAGYLLSATHDKMNPKRENYYKKACNPCGYRLSSTFSTETASWTRTKRATNCATPRYS